MDCFHNSRTVVGIIIYMICDYNHRLLNRCWIDIPMTSLLFVFSIHKVIKYKLSLYCNTLTIESINTYNTPCTLHILYALSENAMEIVPHG